MFRATAADRRETIEVTRLGVHGRERNDLPRRIAAEQVGDQAGVRVHPALGAQRRLKLQA